MTPHKFVIYQSLWIFKCFHFFCRQKDVGHHDDSRSPSPDHDDKQHDPASISDPRLRRLLAARMREREEQDEEEEEEEDRVARLKRHRRIQVSASFIE